MSERQRRTPLARSLAHLVGDWAVAVPFAFGNKFNIEKTASQTAPFTFLK